MRKLLCWLGLHCWIENSVRVVHPLTGVIRKKVFGRMCCWCDKSDFGEDK